MIGKPEWFTRRKYGGWGIYPKTWQGWAYVAVLLAAVMAVQFFPFGNSDTKMFITFGIAAVFAADALSIMVRIKKDEREKLHEAIAERNAMWAMIIVLTVGIGYEAASSVVLGKVQVDPFIIAALLAAVVVKAVSNIYLDRRD